MSAPDILDGALDDTVVAFPPRRDETREILETSIEILNREIEKGERVLGFLLRNEPSEPDADVRGWMRNTINLTRDDLAVLRGMRDAELEDLSGMQRGGR